MCQTCTCPVATTRPRPSDVERRPALRDQQEPAAIDPVRDRSREQPEREDRHRAQCAADAEQDRRTSDVIQKPRCERLLHPATALRDGEAGEVKREVAMTERGKPRSEAHRCVIYSFF